MRHLLMALASVYVLGAVSTGTVHGLWMADRGWPVTRVVQPSLLHGLTWPARVPEALGVGRTAA